MLKGYGPVIKIALLLIIIGAPAYALYSIYAPAANDEAQLLAPVRRGDIETTIVATGQLEPKRYVEVGAQVFVIKIILFLALFLCPVGYFPGLQAGRFSTGFAGLVAFELVAFRAERIDDARMKVFNKTKCLAAITNHAAL